MNLRQYTVLGLCLAYSATLAQQGREPISRVGDEPCPCSGRMITRLPIPATRTHIDAARGRPPALEDERTPTVSMHSNLDPNRTLPTPTSGEISDLDKRFARLLQRSLFASRQTIPLLDVYREFPELRDRGFWVWENPWIIRKRQNGFWSGNFGRGEVYFGAAIIYADLDSIKRAERDYERYQRLFSSDYAFAYPVAESYRQGLGNECPFVDLDVFYRIKGRFGCLGGADMLFHIREHCDGIRLVVDYYSTSGDLYWLSGRDTYFPVSSISDASGIVGYLIITAFGFDIKDCWDSGFDVRKTIHQNLIQFMKRGAED